MTEPAPSLPEGWALIPQPFESEVFSAPVLQLRIGSGSVPEGAPAAVVAAWAERIGAGLVMARISAAAGIASALTEAGFRWVETLVTLDCPVPERAIYPDQVEIMGEEFLADCAALAGKAFIYDRFHADQRISPSIASSIKERWVRNAFAGRADRCFVASRDGKVTGFLLTVRRDDALVIDLVAVAPGEQGRGVGRALVSAAKARGRECGAAVIRVGTQQANLASLRLYHGAGFVARSEARTFHWMPDGKGGT